MAPTFYRVLSVSVIAAALVLTGCSKATPPQSASSSVPPSASTATTSASAKPTVKPKPAGKPSLGGRCEDLLPITTVEVTLRRPLLGKTAFILGVPEADIGRLVYLNCRYGIPTAVKGKPAPVAQVEIGLSLYRSATQAGVRVTGTVDDTRNHGGVSRAVKVGTYPGYVLTGYGDPTLVFSAGPRTFAVTATRATVPGNPIKALVAVGALALTATAKYTG